MALGQARIRLPHDGLELEEFGHEARPAVVDHLVAGMDCTPDSARLSMQTCALGLTLTVLVGLDIP